MRNKIIIVAAVVAVLAVTAAVWCAVAQQARRVPAKTVLAGQQAHVDRLWKLIDNLDAATSLYVTGTIDRDAYAKHLDIAEAELAALKSARQKELDEHPVAVGTHTYATKTGLEAVDGLYTDTARLLAALRATTDTAHASYTYMAWHQRYADRLASYTAAMQDEGLEARQDAAPALGESSGPDGSQTDAQAPDTGTKGGD